MVVVPEPMEESRDWVETQTVEKKQEGLPKFSSNPRNPIPRLQSRCGFRQRRE